MGWGTFYFKYSIVHCPRHYGFISSNADATDCKESTINCLSAELKSGHIGTLSRVSYTLPVT